MKFQKQGIFFLVCILLLSLLFSSFFPTFMEGYDNIDEGYNNVEDELKNDTTKLNSNDFVNNLEKEMDDEKKLIHEFNNFRKYEKEKSSDILKELKELSSSPELSENHKMKLTNIISKYQT